MERLKFEAKGHRYYLDGKSLTGVTTIIGILDKPALVQWSANMAVDYIAKEIKSRDCDMQKMVDFILPEARKAWAKKRDKAGDIGTEVHQMIEYYANSQIKGEKNVIVSTNAKVQKMFDKFVEWAEENQVKFLLSEQKIYSEKHWFAGTVDLIIEIKGRKYIADIKTARDIYNTNYIQMAGYHIALEELGKIKDLAGYIVINIPKDFKADGSAKLKEKRIHNYKDFQDAFLHCLALYRFINKVK